MKQIEHQKKSNNAVRLQRKKEIYQKALDLFVRLGYDATSMSMIADVLHISKANLYYYCQSKENLLFQIHIDFLEKHFIPILIEAEKLFDPKERLSFFFRKTTLMNTSNNAGHFLLYELHSLSRNHQSAIMSIYRRAYNLVRGCVKELQDLGEARNLRTSFVTFMGIGMVSWIHYWFDYSRQANAEELAETLIDVYLNGFLHSYDEKNSQRKQK